MIIALSGLSAFLTNVNKLLQSKFCKQSFTELWVDKNKEIKYI